MTALEIIPIETPNLGDRSYVVGRGATAIVIDPQRDIDRVEEILASRGWSATHVLETHFHNDYVSGGLELSRVVGAEYVVPDGMATRFTAHAVSDKDEMETGVGLVRVLHTPGHTPNHLSFSVNHDGRDVALFTGGSLLFGSVGRTDLLGPDLTEPLAHAQWASMRRIAQEVSPTAGVYPTHGFGSFCSATATVGNSSTVADQVAANPAFTTDEEDFVRDLIAGLDAYPTYYAHMGPANLHGAGPIDLGLPSRADAAEIAARMARGEWIVDLRSRRAFAADHVRGTLSFDGNANAVTYLGWTIDWGTPITLLAESPEEITRMQRELVRIGIDRPAAYATGTPSEWASESAPVSSYLRVDHRGMAAALAADPALPMLDLRRRSEWQDGHVRGARHIPLHEVRPRMAQIVRWAQESGPLWVYCGSGFRAAIGASMMAAQGVDVIHVDDDFGNAAPAGLPIVLPGHDSRLGDAYAD